MTASAFHAGELALQRRAGTAGRMALAGPRLIRDHLPAQHREFFALLPFLLLGLVDAAGHPRIGLVAGAPGFAHSPDERLLRIDALPSALDPTAPLLRVGACIGLLGIQQHTRRRNRMNGRVVQLDASGFTVRVDQSFGNCPRYIQAREPQFEPRVLPAALEHGEGVDAAAARAIAAADTFFIASAHPQAGQGGSPLHGVDVSHRGGKPGFVLVEGDRLSVPDFAGNGYFNTLGNLLLEPRCALLFVDPATGTPTWIAAQAEVVDAPAQAARFAGAQRLLHLRAHSFARVTGGLPLRWGPAVPAPELAATGEWAGPA